MKSLLLGALVTLGLGCAGYEVRETSATEALAPVEGCEVTAECLPDGTCRIEGRGPNGESCWALLRCSAEGDCEVLDCGGEGCDPADGEALEDCMRLPECPTEARQACASAKTAAPQS